MQLTGVCVGGITGRPGQVALLCRLRLGLYLWRWGYLKLFKEYSGLAKFWWGLLNSGGACSNSHSISVYLSLFRSLPLLFQKTFKLTIARDVDLYSCPAPAPAAAPIGRREDT